MATLAVLPGVQAAAAEGYPPAGWSMCGRYQARRLSPDGVSLWLFELRAGCGSVLRWSGDHGDEALYVLAGSVRVAAPGAEQVVTTDGAVILESGVAADVVAGEDSRLLHMGAVDTSVPVDAPAGAPEAGGHVVHAVGPGGIYAECSPGRETRFYADSSCRTCRITLMKTGRSQRYVSAPHSHSQDELIHVLSGELILGRWALGPGDTLFVAADRRYTFTSGDDGFSFLNYRRDASMHTIVRGGQPVLEGGAAHGFAHVADVVDLASRIG